MGVIFQDFMRYEMTVRENIGVGQIEVSHSDADIALAAQKSLAAEVVKKLPGGYDQMLGRRFVTGLDPPAENGKRIALARAYLRDAQLLILDRALTRGPRCKKRAGSLSTLRRADRGANGSAHFPSIFTVPHADRASVVLAGRAVLVEMANPPATDRLGGQYAEMFRMMQAASYR